MALKPMSKDDIVLMRNACRLASQTLDHVQGLIKPGLTTMEINQIVEDFAQSHGAVSGPLGYHGYPYSVCTSVNEVVCHGIPTNYKLKDGDIINVDVTPKLQGFFGDSSRTFFVGTPSGAAKDLVEVAKRAMEIGIEAIVPGATTGDIGFEVNKYVTRKGYTTIKDIGGHGIGRVFHDEPFVPSWGKKGKGDRLTPWTCITVEPMVNQGTDEHEEHDIPGTSIKYYTTVDKKLSAQFEHTILITDTGYEILTLS